MEVETHESASVKRPPSKAPPPEFKARKARTPGSPLRSARRCASTLCRSTRRRLRGPPSASRSIASAPSERATLGHCPVDDRRRGCRPRVYDFGSTSELASRDDVSRRGNPDPSGVSLGFRPEAALTLKRIASATSAESTRRDNPSWDPVVTGLSPNSPTKQWRQPLTRRAVDADEKSDTLETIAAPLLTAYALERRDPRPLGRIYDRRHEALDRLKRDYLAGKR